MPFEHRADRRRRRGLYALATVLSTILLTSCLLPTEYDPTGYSPVGNLEIIAADGASIRAVGWAIDPDLADSLEVRMGIDGTTTSYRADVARYDIAAAYPRHGAQHGFDIRSAALSPGVHDVCVWVVNIGNGTRDRGLGCATVVTGSDSAVGSFDSVQSPGPNLIRVDGWAYDPEAADSIDVTVTISGRAQRVRADQFRENLRAFIQKSGRHGLSVDLLAAGGRHEVCVVAHNVGRGSDAGLGCRTVVVNDGPAPLVGGDLATNTPVGPPAGHPLHGIDRDGGASTKLRDGTTLWFFGDSLEPTGGGGFRYFVNNTAAVSSRSNPSVTRDGVLPGNVPATFVVPAASFTTPCPAGFASIMWPLSATNTPVANTNQDRVIAFFGNVCLRGQDMRSRGVAVVEWIYDPAQFTSQSAVGPTFTGRVLNQNLFPIGSEYGTASQIVDGQLYAYACGRPDDTRTEPAWPNDAAYSGCTVARVDPAQVQDRAAWQFWTGTTTNTWVPEMSRAGKMDLPRLPGDAQTPVAAFSVVTDRVARPNAPHVMVYSPWPGFTDRVFVRTAATPVGPWSAPTSVQLPGCNQWTDGSGRFCYAGTAQPQASTPGRLGIGYFDQFVTANPVRGSYLLGTTPR